MHPPTFKQLIEAYSSAHSTQLQQHTAFLTRAEVKILKRHCTDDSIPDDITFTHALLIVQHVHDRVAPWRLSPLLLNYLYNKGVSVLTLSGELVDLRRVGGGLTNKMLTCSEIKAQPTLPPFGGVPWVICGVPKTYTQTTA